MKKIFDVLAVISFFSFILLFFVALCAEPNSEADWEMVESFSKEWGKIYITALYSTLAYLFVYIIALQIKAEKK